MQGSVDIDLQQRLGLQGCFVIGFVGSFYGYEGLDVLVAALPEILALEPGARLLLVGGGLEKNALLAQARAAGVSDKIVMPGRVPHAEVSDYYSLVDVLAFPRKSMRLTELVTPLKPLEAMAQGKLVMASDVGGHRELIRDGETGYLFKPDSPAALAATTKRVLGDRRHWDQVRSNGRRFVESERTWQRSAAGYLTAYDNARRSWTSRLTS
jgi:glycosyltransferase involved in cell wall biosynthesis